MASTREWWEDHSELIGFARWYWEGPNIGIRPPTTEVIDYFEKPWKYTEEYEGYKKDVKNT